MLKRILLLGSLAIIIFLSGCDKGVEPRIDLGPAGFGGKVTFTGPWPEGIKRTHLVVFKNPIVTTADFFLPNLTFICDSIPYGSAEFNYNSFDNKYVDFLSISEGNYSYVVVAQSKTPNISFERKDWYVVGVYCINGDQSKPATLTLLPGETTENVNIVVDFKNPPPQPPE